MPTLDELVAGLGNAQSGFGAITSPFAALGGGGPVGVAPSVDAAPAVVSPFQTELARQRPRRGGVAGAMGVQGAKPLLAGLPENLTRLERKWQELAPILAQFPEPIQRSLAALDSDRVAGGSQPLTREQTLLAAQTAMTNEQATKEPDKSVWNVPKNFVSDLTAVVRSVPRIPTALIHELQDIPRITDRIAEEQAAGTNPISAIARAPGVRLLPGAYIAANLGDPAELARHPLFSLLDVLPAAKGLANTTRAGKAAIAESRITGMAPNTLKAATMRSVDSAGNLTPNKLGRAVERVTAETVPGRAMSQIWGRASREASHYAEMEAGGIIAKQTGASPVTDPAEVFMRESAALREKYNLTPDDAKALTVKLTASDYSNMSPNELAFTSEARRLTEGYGDVMVDEGRLSKIMVDGRYEFYPREVGEHIAMTRGRAEGAARISVLRTEMLNPTNTFDQARAAAAWDTAAANPVQRIRDIELRAIAHTAEANGFDTALVRKALRKGDIIGAKMALDAMPHVGEVYNVLDIMKELRRNRQHVQSNILAAALRDGNTIGVTRALNNILDQGNSQPLFAADPDFARSVRTIRDRLVFDRSTLRAFTPKQAAQYAKRAEALVSRNAPARFDATLAKSIKAKMIERLLPPGRIATPAEIADITSAVVESRWGHVDRNYTVPNGMDAVQMYRGIENEVVGEWRELARQGADPVFVHKVSRSRAATVARPRIGPVPQTLSQTKERALDMSPGVDDITVALTHQGVEILSQRASERFIEHIIEGNGIQESVLRDVYADRARALAETSNVSFDAALNDLLSRRMERFNPDTKGYSWGGAKLDKYRQEGYWIPRPLAENLRRMHDPKGTIAGVVDPITKTFRMAVVGLSPRTQLYNILGGATMVMGQTGPSVFRFYRQAREMVKNPQLIENELVRSTIGGAKRSFTDSEFVRADAAKNVMLGKTMGRWMTEGAAGRVGRGVGAVVDKSLDLNAFFDDQYRVMAYLYGKDKTITKGLSREAAENAGVELMRKSMMDWTGLTPIERSVFKSIFPFYGFMNHAVRYVMRYPVDHPLRASVLAAFGRAEQEDLGALPASFLASIFVGEQSATGQQTALNMAPINPFGDVANMFTVAGFLSATNPLMQTVLEQAGLARGQAELYPTLRYDPETGRLAATRPNPLTGFVENVIPQSKLITSLLGVNGEYNSRQMRDPAGARRQLLSAAGLPVLWRGYNIPAEQTKGELARIRSQDAAKADALKTGNWGEALRYPGLQDYFATLSQVPAETLQAFTPPERDALAAQLMSIIGPDAGPGTLVPGAMARTGGI